MKAISFLFLLLLSGCASKNEKAGALDPIREGIMTKYVDLQECYRESDTYLNKKSIKIVYQFAIENDGSTVDHEILNQTEKDPNFSVCFKNVMKTLKYEIREVPIEQKQGKAKMILPPAQKLLIKQPFNFIPGNT